jgi:hypothetical protein
MSNKAFNTITGSSSNTSSINEQFNTNYQSQYQSNSRSNTQTNTQTNSRSNTQSNSQSNFQSNTQSNFQSNLDKYRNNFDPTNVGVSGDQIRVSNYEVLNNYDQGTLDRMSSNVIDFTSPNANQEYQTQQVPPYSSFVNPREPSLNVGMRGLPISNMTVLPNQLNRSLDLLAQTDVLAITNMHKKSNLLDKSNIINTNELDETLDKFQGVAVPHIPYDQYEKPTALFDNFAGEGRKDVIREYICHINSIDRDIKRYPNPFNFLVKCAPLAGETNASISRTFENIRYIKIETAVLPKKYFVTKNKINNHPDIVNSFINPLPKENTLINISSSPNVKFVIIYSYEDNTSGKQYINYTIYEPDISIPILVCYEAIKDIFSGMITTYQYDMSCLSLENDKYTILYLNDITNISQYSTDQTLSKAFNVLYPDILSGDSIYVDCRYADKLYKFSSLGNLKKMDITLTNSLGKTLSVNVKALDFNVPDINTTSCICKSNMETGNIERNFRCLCNYIRHPRYIKNQIDLMFKLGVVETDFDKRAFN